MNKYIVVVVLGIFVSVYAYENPFSLAEHLQEIDNEKRLFLNELQGREYSSRHLYTNVRDTNKSSRVVLKSKKCIVSIDTEINHPAEDYLEAERDIINSKKIPQLHVKASGIRQHQKLLNRHEKEKKLQKKHVKNKQNIKSAKKQIYLDTLNEKAVTQILTNTSVPKDTVLTKKTSIEKAYLDAIKAVDQ